MSTPQSDAKPSLLLVDDDSTSLLVMNKALESDYSIRFATNGAQALELVQASPPDLILLDMMMPGMGGTEVMEQLRADETTRRIPVLFVTARVDPQTETQALATGADDFIHKPINLSVLRARIASQLERHRLRHALEHQRDQLEDEVRERTRSLEAERANLAQRVADRTAELRESNQQLEMALEATDLGLWEYAIPTGHFTWSERHRALLGLATNQLDGTLADLRRAIHPRDRRGCLRGLHRSLREGVNFDQIYRVIGPTGDERWLHSQAKLLRELTDTTEQRLVGTTRDISTLKVHERELERMAHYDALTDLPNRVLLSSRLRQAMARARRHQRALVLIYLDLDGFKAVNDTHGHAIGDRLLIAVAHHMQRTLREVDTLGRLGGDEFVAILADLSPADAYVPLVERLRHAAAQPQQIEGRELQVSATLGIACYPQATEVDGDQLLRQADQAMYQAKQNGRNCYQLAAQCQQA